MTIQISALIFTPSQPAPNQGPAAKGREIRCSLTAQDPRHRLPRVSSGKCEQQIVDATPALELAVLTRCEYAKPRKPAVPAPNTKCATTARDMNPAMRVVEKRNFSLMHLGDRVHWENNRGNDDV